MLKRVFSLLLAALLLLGVLSSALAAGDMQEGSMYVNTANGRALRFRSSKETSPSNILKEIPYGDKVFVLDWDGTWARIRYDNAVGYVVKKYLSIARPLPHDVVVAQREAEKAAQKAAREAAKQAAAEKKQAEKEAQEALNRLRTANAKLDHSKLKEVAEYDVTVRVGVVDLGVNLYEKADLTSVVVSEYEDGVRLTVRSQNKDWALVYNGATDVQGYMLLEDLEPDVMEDVLLDDE